ncbi:MAG: Mov34/MPN/PAD-1 family protein, partial [Nitrospinota bacterium]
HFVTGVRMGRVLTLDQMVGLNPAKDSAIYARADEASVRRELVRMEEMGHAPHGLFHSHPGGGPSGTRPSGTDRATHERYERGGHSLVGAIFTKDGHVRFFSHAAPFHVAVFGKGARKVHENLFHLEAPESD